MTLIIEQLIPDHDPHYNLDNYSDCDPNYDHDYAEKFHVI